MDAPKTPSAVSDRELDLIELLRSNPTLMGHVEKLAQMTRDPDCLLKSGHLRLFRRSPKPLKVGLSRGLSGTRELRDRDEVLVTMDRSAERTHDVTVGDRLKGRFSGHAESSTTVCEKVSRPSSRKLEVCQSDPGCDSRMLNKSSLNVTDFVKQLLF